MHVVGMFSQDQTIHRHARQLWTYTVRQNTEDAVTNTLCAGANMLSVVDITLILACVPLLHGI